jgi:multiple sugar transport system permease protein
MATGTPEGRTITPREWWKLVRRARSEAWGDLTGYLFILPMLTLFLLFNAWPILRGFTMAFTDYRFVIPGTEWSFNGAENYIEMANDPVFWRSLGRSLYFTFLYVPASIIIPLVVATLISRVAHQGLASVYRVIVYLPVVLPIAVALLLWKQLFDTEFGYINIFLNQVVGLPIKPGWLSDPSLTMPVMVTAVLWKSLGSNVLLFLIGLYNINRELYDAASVDGAGALQQWWYVTLPLLKPVLTIVLVLSADIISATQEPLIMFNGGGPLDSVHTLGLYTYMVAFRWGDLRWGYAAAMGLVVGVTSILMSIAVFRALRTERLW